MRNAPVLLMAALLLTSVGSLSRCRALKEENRSLHITQNVLLGDLDKFKVKDSLNAAKVAEMGLDLKTLRKYRAEDMELIKEMTSRNEKLAALAKTSTVTKYVVKTEVRDSIVYIDNSEVPTKSIDVHTKWYDVQGALIKDSLTLDIQTRDSLLITETIERRRFLFIHWGEKSKKYSIVSKNPNTSILGWEFIRVAK